MEPKHIIALEIGSSKIRGASGTYDPVTGAVTVTAVQEEKLVDCVRYGCIQNVAEVTNRVRSIINRLQDADPSRVIKGVYVGIGGRSLSASATPFERRFATDTEITTDIINNIFDEARSAAFVDRDIIDVTPREFRIDSGNVARPVGNMSRSISAVLNLISARPQIKRNINTVVRDRLGLAINGYIVRQIAISNVVLSYDESRLGCMLVDFGAETTTVSIHRGGMLQYLATLPMGSRNITRDITALNHLEENAEQLKIRSGNVSKPSMTAAYGAYDPAAPYGGDFVEMNNYVAARAGEIIANIIQQIKYAGLTADKLPGGIVIVGNGARLRGFNEALSEAAEMSVHVGTPTGISIKDPSIHLSEAVDVISILHAAATGGGRDCTESLRRAQPQPQPQPKTSEPTWQELQAQQLAQQQAQQLAQQQAELARQQEAQRARQEAEMRARERAEREAKQQNNPTPEPGKKNIFTRLADWSKGKILEAMREDGDDEFDAEDE